MLEINGKKKKTTEIWENFRKQDGPERGKRVGSGFPIEGKKQLTMTTVK